MVKQDVKDEVLYLRAAGVDIGKRFAVACVPTPAAQRAGTWSLETEKFGTTPAEIRRLLAWLLERQVEVVVRWRTYKTARRSSSGSCAGHRSGRAGVLRAGP